MAVETHNVAGVVAGRNPLEYVSSSPYTIFLFQAVFIILLCQLVHYPVSRLQQPRVIAEVITGILLGPTVMGRIPKFTETCFPDESIPGLTLFANIGVILLLFIIGLEVDVQFIKKNAKVALSVGLINMAVPFALGFGIAKGIYNEYGHNADISFSTYGVYIAVAMCITAFPVLVRILTELNLIVDRVGTIVLAAGILNDLTGWILLALAITLANSAKGITTLYILLLTVAWFIFLVYPVRIALKWFLRKFTNDLVSGEPSQLLMMLILVGVFVSAFYTDIIGVHPIFGAFMMGVVVPRDKGYVIRITEKLEDLVHVIMIPIYFALAGLNVNLGLLDRGIDWAYTIGIILLSMTGKIAGGFIAGRLNRLLWRESLAIGVLMSCKGIVEIVVLTLGLNAGIISQRVYSMFVVMALVATFLTTPLTLLVYPVSYREKVQRYLNGESWDITSTTTTTTDDDSLTFQALERFRVSKMVVLLKRIDTISNLMTFVHDFGLKGSDTSNYSVDLKAIHLREFTTRTSHLLEASHTKHDETDTLVVSTNEHEVSNSSSILSIMKIFAEFLGIDYTSKSLLTTTKNRLWTINEQISEKSDLLIDSISTSQLIQDSREASDFSGDSIDSSEFALFKELFQSSKAHFALLLVNNRKDKVGKLNGIPETEDDGRSLFSLKSVNLVLGHEDVVSKSDLLALHLAYKLSFNLTHVNVFLRSNSDVSGFEKQIELLFTSGNPSINLNINKVKDGVAFSDEIIRLKANLAGETFIVANNIAKESVKLFEPSVGELVGAGVAEGFNVLAVKAAS